MNSFNQCDLPLRKSISRYYDLVTALLEAFRCGKAIRCERTGLTISNVAGHLNRRGWHEMNQLLRLHTRREGTDIILWVTASPAKSPAGEDGKRQ